MLDVYFRQCAILVTARDLAIMAATLANGGRNPVTEEQIISPYVVSRTLSVMTSSGMYDYAGEWIYRVGIPAKSGVGGGIIASLPAQLGLGTFSPRLDDHGNSVRGLKVCEALSAHYALHVLNRNDDIRTCIIADYPATGLRRGATARKASFSCSKSGAARSGSWSLSALCPSRRWISCRADCGGRRTAAIHSHRSASGAERDRRRRAARRKIIENVHPKGRHPFLAASTRSSRSGAPRRQDGEIAQLVRYFQLLDDAIEWAEDQVIFRYGGFEYHGSTSHLNEQALLDGLFR